MPALVLARRLFPRCRPGSLRPKGCRLWTWESLEERIAPAQSPITVTSLLDGNNPPRTTSLRQAITRADSQPGSTIDFDPNLFKSGPGTIALQGALPDLSANVTIQGPGASTLTVKGRGSASNFSIFAVDNGVTALLSGLTISGGFADFGGGVFNGGSLTLSGSTLSGNFAGNGGGVFNGGSLTLSGSTLSENSASFGGGVYNRGILTLTRSTLSGNSAHSGGGGVANYGTLTIAGSTLAGNSAKQNGGGIANNGTLTLTDSTLSGSLAEEGGGVANFGTLTVTGSTLSGNTAFLAFFAGGEGQGGGLYNHGTATLTNSTLSGNTAYKYGGGVLNSGTLTLTNATLTGNSVSGYGHGGGISLYGGSLTLSNTVVAGNFHKSNPSDISGQGKVVSSSAYNLIGTGGSGGLVNGQNHSLVGVSDPKLGRLADNGGPTQTVALLPGSPAIGAGSVALAVDPITKKPLQYDQRGPGFARVVFGQVDIGAFEVQPITITVTTLLDGNNPPGTTSLRQAITQADSQGVSVIDFDPNLFKSGPGTIALQGALPDLSADARIEGPGASTLTVKGGGSSSNFSVFTVDNGVTALLSGLTISGGHANQGGGVDNIGALTLSGCTLSGNSAYSGGGVANRSTLTITDSTLTGNSAYFSGGGVANSGTLTITDSALSGNSVTRNGGGAYNGFGGTLTLTDTTLSGNTAKSGGGVLNIGTLTLTKSTLTGNSASYGGGVLNGGGGSTLTIDGSTLYGNKAVYGGGVLNSSGSTLTLSGSAFTANTATDGGAVRNNGTATITDCTINVNPARAQGGGVDNSGTLTIVGSTFDGNAAPQGGGLFNLGASTLTECNFYGNVGSTAGGGVYSIGALTITGTTLSANGAHSGGLGGGLYSSGSSVLVNSTLYGNVVSTGGGIVVAGGSLNLNNVTVTGNRATGGIGGGIAVLSGTVVLANTIVAQNFGVVAGKKASDIHGRVARLSFYNLIGTGGSGGLINGLRHNQVGVSRPALGPLAYNGGPTKTVALLSRSPARGAGSVALAVNPITRKPLKYDQRGPGFARVVNGKVDIGAFEVQPASLHRARHRVRAPLVRVHHDHGPHRR